MWDLRRVFGCSRPFKKISIAQKWAKIAGIRQKLAGSMEKVYSHVFLAHKLHKNAFCEPKKFYRMLRRPPATYWRLKTEYFFKKWQKWKKMVNFLFKTNVFQMFSNRLNFMSFNSKESQLQNVLPIFLVMFTCEPFVSNWCLNKNLSCVVKSMLSNFRHFMFLHFLSILLNHRCMWWI